MSNLTATSVTSSVVELKTIDNTKVKIQKANVGAIEEIPASVRTESYTKIYVSGFEFKVAMAYAEVSKLIFG